MTALGKLGDCAAARSALRVYLKSGGLRTLLFASIGALQRCDELNPFLGQMIENKNDRRNARSEGTHQTQPCGGVSGTEIPSI